VDPVPRLSSQRPGASPPGLGPESLGWLDGPHRGPTSTAPRPHRVAVLQSNYLPWRGTFDLIARVDTFVIYDVVQYTKNDWRNRNRVKGPGGLQWLTIPVARKRLGQTIAETRVADPRWARKHWRTLEQCYRRAPSFEAVAEVLAPAYRELADEPSLSTINESFLRLICGLLGIPTRIVRAEGAYLPDDRNERLLAVLKRLGATHYLSGPSARSYLDEPAFEEAGVRVEWMRYPDYPAYPQLHGVFEPAVSVVDLLFHMGGEARRYLQPAAGPEAVG
jgi:hypothetical protein